jgi:putative ABC transport system permease protein
VDGASSSATIAPSLLEQVRKLPSVEAASGSIMDFSGSSTYATLVDRAGEPIGRNGNPTFGFGVDPRQERFNPLTLVEGAWASGPREVVIDAATAKDSGYGVGDAIGVATDGKPSPYEVVGVARFGEVDSLGGATIAVFDVPTAQRLLHKDGFDAIYVGAKDGVSPEHLAQEIRPILPPTVEAKTGEEQAAASGREVSEFVSYFRYFLLAFGAIALFVGGFVIFNTLSMTVAQRMRELATLRTLGGSRRQVLRSVVLEAGVIGLGASVVGLFLGLGLAKVLSMAFGWLGVTLPEAGTVFAGRTIIVSLVAGTLIAVLAGLIPAIRATRVSPLAAVREGATLPKGRLSRYVPGIALAVIALGGGLLAYSLFANGLPVATVLGAMALGIIALFIGVAMISSRLVKPIAAAVGWPGRSLGGTPGQLGSENSVRNPGRTASTAAALMIGLALVTVVAVLGKGLRSANETAIEKQVHAEYVLTSENGFDPFTALAGDAVSSAAGVESATSVRGDRGKVGTKSIDVNGVDPASIRDGYAFEWSSGSDASLAALGTNGAIVKEKFADDRNLVVGEHFALLTPQGKKLSLVVRGIFSPPKLDSLLGSVVISQAAFDGAFQRPRNDFTFVNVRGDGTEAALQRSVAGYPDAKLQTRDEFVTQRAKGFGQLLNLLYVLLAFSVIVSLFGMVNTLVLSVYERTREIGMLRAVGMTRSQVRAMVRHESVITALIGAVLGIGLGVAIAGFVISAMSDLDVAFTLPVGTLAVFALAAAVAGVLAAVLPARRASRLNVLESLHYE